MKDSVPSDSAHPAPNKPAIPGSAGIGTQPVRQPLILNLIMTAAVLVCCAFAAVAEANTTTAAAIGYLSLVVAFFACAIALWTRARSMRGQLRIRWALISAAALADAIAYTPSFTEFLFHTPAARVLQTTCFNACEALILLAAMLSLAGVSRWVVIVDTLQIWLFFLLRFILVYSPVTRDHFTSNHLLVAQLVALFLFLVPTVACLGATSRAELNFLRTLSWFLGIRLIGYFLSDQVSYIWLGYTNCSLWDVPSSGLIAGFAVYLLYSSPSPDSLKAKTEPIAASLMVRSLMPSFLAMVNLMLGLFVLQISVTLAAIAISVSLLCYVVRTGLLQAQVMNDKALLQSRNEQLEGLAIRDHLTGIGNRRSLAGVYGNLSALAGGEKLSLLLTDIDCFKQANDFHGHLYGDNVLIALARDLEILAAGIPGSHCARLGGDEFALLLPDVTPQQASELANELHSLFSSHRFQTDDTRTTLSVGIASLSAARNLPLETLVCRADEALYRAKNLGRNRTEVQSPLESGTPSTMPGKLLKLQRTEI